MQSACQRENEEGKGGLKKWFADITPWQGDVHVAIREKSPPPYIEKKAILVKKDRKSFHDAGNARMLGQ
ncbi:hypothetical protein [Noviherbaspirillum soli]|uniref:hypothetical protein n=1 Tax=Noviherbaspirillum soli TaxID=1064518 RepID=UPI00188CFB8A|nr:hypothetical protein [Noviherbaspirillum soli]